MSGKSEDTIVEPDDICKKCGSKMIKEDGKFVCPHCDGEIDFFGDNEDE